VNPPVNREVTLESVRAWFDDLVAFWERHGEFISVLSDAAAQDREIAAMQDGSTRTSIGLLAGWIEDAGTDEDSWLRAMLLHAETSEFLRRTVIKGWPADIPRGLDLLAERWYAALARTT
jgi:hypothetical protein